MKWRLNRFNAPYSLSQTVIVAVVRKLVVQEMVGNIVKGRSDYLKNLR